MKATNCGVAMDKNAKARFFLKDYVQVKYDGLPANQQRVILYPYFQHRMQHGQKY